MPTLKVFNPTCCSADERQTQEKPEFTQLDSDLSFLEKKGIAVERFNLKDHKQDFDKHAQVRAAMGSKDEGLPIFMWDDEIVSKGIYPTRDQLSKWVDLDAVLAAEGGCCSGGQCG